MIMCILVPKCVCVCRSVGFAPVTVGSIRGMSITLTVQLSARYKENKIEGGKRGREELLHCLKFNLRQNGWMDEGGGGGVSKRK